MEKKKEPAEEPRRAPVEVPPRDQRAADPREIGRVVTSPEAGDAVAGHTFVGDA